MDRQAINQALAKSLAYANAGKSAEASAWAKSLITLLEEAAIEVASRR